MFTQTFPPRLAQPFDLRVMKDLNPVPVKKEKKAKKDISRVRKWKETPMNLRVLSEQKLLPM